MKLFILLILTSITLFSQQLDSLIVTMKNPSGDAVVGVKKGYSKLIIQSGITNLEFDPAHTKSNSEHFKIVKTTTGYNIFINVGVVGLST